jgi:hypothetical protein
MSFVLQYLKKDPASIVASDVESFVAQKLDEVLTLEYKAFRKIEKPEELSTDLSAFANSGGGLLMLGVSETKTAPHQPERVDWGDEREYSKERVENLLITKIVPKIDGMRILPVRGNSPNQIMYLFDVPQSKNPPHMAGDKKYYKRLNFQSLPMEHYELVRLFTREINRSRDHSMNLVGDPLKEFGNYLLNPESVQIFILNVSRNRLDEPYKLVASPRAINFELIGKPSLELFVSHLKSGENKFFKQALAYQEKYNGLISRVEDIYESIREDVGNEQKYWSNSFLTSLEEFLALLSQEVQKVVTNGIQPNVTIREIAPSSVVFISSTAVISSEDRELVNSARDFISRILIGGYRNEFMQVWKDARLLSVERNAIMGRLERLKLHVEQGVQIEGYCDAGRVAGYE